MPDWLEELLASPESTSDEKIQQLKSTPKIRFVELYATEQAPLLLAAHFAAYEDYMVRIALVKRITENCKKVRYACGIFSADSALDKFHKASNPSTMKFFLTHFPKGFIKSVKQLARYYVIVKKTIPRYKEYQEAHALSLPKNVLASLMADHTRLDLLYEEVRALDPTVTKNEMCASLFPLINREDEHVLRTPPNYAPNINFNCRCSVETFYRYITSTNSDKGELIAHWSDRALKRIFPNHLTILRFFQMFGEKELRSIFDAKKKLWREIFKTTTLISVKSYKQLWGFIIKELQMPIVRRAALGLKYLNWYLLLNYANQRIQPLHSYSLQIIISFLLPSVTVNRSMLQSEFDKATMHFRSMKEQKTLRLIRLFDQVPRTQTKSPDQMKITDNTDRQNAVVESPDPAAALPTPNRSAVGSTFNHRPRLTHRSAVARQHSTDSTGRTDTHCNLCNIS